MFVHTQKERKKKNYLEHEPSFSETLVTVSASKSSVATQSLKHTHFPWWEPEMPHFYVVKYSQTFSSNFLSFIV